MENEKIQSEEIIAATDTNGGIGEEIEVVNIELTRDGDINGENND